MTSIAILLHRLILIRLIRLLLLMVLLVVLLVARLVVLRLRVRGEHVVGHSRWGRGECMCFWCGVEVAVEFENVFLEEHPAAVRGDAGHNEEGAVQHTERC